MPNNQQIVFLLNFYHFYLTNRKLQINYKTLEQI
jgi:hypothetical protein